MGNWITKDGDNEKSVLKFSRDFSEDKYSNATNLAKTSIKCETIYKKQSLLRLKVTQTCADGLSLLSVLRFLCLFDETSRFFFVLRIPASVERSRAR